MANRYGSMQKLCKVLCKFEEFSYATVHVHSKNSDLNYCRVHFANQKVLSENLLGHLITQFIYVSMKLIRILPGMKFQV